MTNPIDYTSPISGEVPDFFADVVRDIANGDTKLDTIETSEDVPNSTGYRAFLISGDLKSITRADRLYQALDKIESKHRLFNFRACHTQASFLRHKESGQIKIGSNSCKLRWCPLCAKARKFIIQQSTAGWIKEKKKPKFITLTLAHSDDDLKDQIDKLYKSFQRLRTKDLWKKKIRGGIWFFQLKKGKGDNKWHPHLHILAHGDYIDKFELALIWKGITNDSQIVDVKKVSNVKSAAQYVARYAAAPVVLSEMSDDDLLLIARAFKGRRICGTFGSARGLQLSIMPPENKDEWETLCSFRDIYESKDYDSIAAEIWDCWKTGRSYTIPPADSPDAPPTVDIKAEIKKAEQKLLMFGN